MKKNTTLMTLEIRGTKPRSRTNETLHTVGIFDSDSALEQYILKFGQRELNAWGKGKGLRRVYYAILSYKLNSDFGCGICEKNLDGNGKEIV